MASNLIPVVIAWCAQVTVAPDVNKIIVFNNGTSQGLKGWIACGGQIDPISIVGAKLEWKNAQKNAKKNIISDTINKIIPYLKPVCTTLVWWPSNVASLITSLHQIIIVSTTKIKPNNITKLPPFTEWKYITEPFIIVNAANAVTKGQGLGSTKWNKCLWLLNIIFYRWFIHFKCIKFSRLAKLT